MSAIDWPALTEQFLAEIKDAQKNPHEQLTESIRIKWLGRKGILTEIFESIKTIDKQDRPVFGKNVNILRTTIEENLSQLIKLSDARRLDELLHKKIDVTLPVDIKKGSLHPVSIVRKHMIDIFKRFGFSVYDGPEIDFEFYNFSALNIPQNHPSRDMQDSFFVQSTENLVLRTQTSNIQIHAMLQERPPLRIVSPGRVFRVDSDATHTPMFHQMECVLVEEGISFSHLKGIIAEFTQAVFGSSLKTRFRPSFFPFVEPGAEIDMQCAHCKGKGCRLCKHTGWLEIGGCGMIHPNVFEAVQYDSERYTGYAFGFGLDRMAMLLFELSDLRQMFEGDSEYHKNFSIHRS